MRLLLLFSMFALAMISVAQGVRYEVTDLTKQYGLTQGQAVIDINNQGVMIGGGDGYAFTIKDGKYSVLERPKGAGQYYAIAVNSSGVILGSASIGGLQRSVLWINGKAVVPDLSPAVGNQSRGPLNGLNNVGDFVGLDRPLTRPIHWSEKNGVTYLERPPGGIGGASQVNDQGVIVGTILANSVIGATRWVGGTYQNLHPSGFVESRGLGIAQNGDIGGEVETTSAFHAGFWRGGTEFIDVGALTPTDFTFFGDLNESEQMVGQATVKGRFAAYLWESGTLYNMQDLVDPKLIWEFDSAAAINDAGQILAGGRRKGPQHANLLLNPVPEPNTFLLLALGGAWILARRRR